MSEPRQVVDIADAWAEREPERVCLTFHPEGRPPVPVTYGSLRAHVLAWAIGLARVAIQPGAPIVLPLHAGRRVPQPNLEGGRALPSGELVTRRTFRALSVASRSLPDCPSPVRWLGGGSAPSAPTPAPLPGRFAASYTAAMPLCRRVDQAFQAGGGGQGTCFGAPTFATGLSWI
jgi:hypothetical protein